ncbi:response regulator [Sandaracinobacteroides saxicola]|uniref:Response regulator n=1 Tax=Sandaracinobacteroides saxicola TaxID=2759707 RepID=A0A7G5IJC9_9SPHN|nr:response regulator [Sandaracinobacteroides saxicola]QMW23471.1 response regulator [Sandaracinobacteroides saxicola]
MSAATPAAVAPVSHPSTRAAFGPHLPFLRRYARALTGSQRSGDAYVRAALEALIADPDSIRHDGDPRVELFRLFHAFWNGVAEESGDEAMGSQGEEMIAQLPRNRREALLLTAVEGFGAADAATILNRSREEVEGDIAAATSSIGAEMACRVLIIEDEPIIALHLQDIVEEMGHSVAGVAMTHKEATAMMAAEPAELVLADIRLADGSSGIDAVNEILAARPVPVIFITAYPERLLTGERPEPTYLITKPFEPTMVVATIGQALMLARQTAG